MPVFIVYLLKLSVSLGVVWIFYQLFLRRLTFYNWNRWYLLLYSLACFVIPFIDLSLYLQPKATGETRLIEGIPIIWNTVKTDPVPVLKNWNPVSIVAIIFGAGVLVMLFRLGFMIFSVRRMGRRATLINRFPAEPRNDEVLVYDVDKPIIPFSFGRSIYINCRLHSEKEWEEIILHEYIHVRQRHTVDILLSELILVVSWYNPFAWLIRFSIRQNLEFIADNKVLENGSDKKEYQYHLLRVVGVAQYRIANNFNFSSLKKRIVMMNAIKSTRLHLVKFLFILPLLAVLLLAFRNQHNAGKDREGNRGPLSVRESDLARKDTVPGKKNDSVAIEPLQNLMNVPALRKPLIIVDGKKMPAGVSLQSINQDSIESITVLKNKASLYGEPILKDVLLITTKEAHARGLDRSVPLGAPGVPAPALSAPAPGVSVPVPGAPVGTGLPPASSGSQVEIRSAPIPADALPMVLIDSLSVANPASVVIRKTIGSDKNILYYIDGVRSSSQAVSKLQPASIGSIEVYKGVAAVSKYGESAREGVIEITLKKDDKPGYSDSLPMKQEELKRAFPSGAVIPRVRSYVLDGKRMPSDFSTATVNRDSLYTVNLLAEMPDSAGKPVREFVILVTNKGHAAGIDPSNTGEPR